VCLRGSRCQVGMVCHRDGYVAADADAFDVDSGAEVAGAVDIVVEVVNVTVVFEFGSDAGTDIVDHVDVAADSLTSHKER